MTTIWTKLNGLALGAALACIATTALADYPEKPINLVVGFGAGGGVDTFARTFAAAAEESLGVPLVVVNKPGAASANAAKQVIRSRPDGYTIFLTNGSTLAAKVMLMGDGAGMDLSTDLINLGSVGTLVTALMVPANSPFQNSADLVAHAKANPGSLRWSHPGRGSLHMLGGAVFLADNGITAQDVPFKGGGKARNAVAGEQVDFGFMGVQLVSGFEEQLRAIGVTSATRDLVFDAVPTFSEQGLPQMQLSGPIAIYAPAGVPEEVVAKLTEAIAAAAQSDTYLGMAQEAGLSAGYLSAMDADATIATVTEMLAPIVAEMAAGN
jgi:tripartite-type tricarboxylate transporter receptor subunit TctC